MAILLVPLRDMLRGNELSADTIDSDLWDKINNAVDKNRTDNPVAPDRIREYEALCNSRIREPGEVEVKYNEFERLENGKGRLLTGQLGIDIAKFYL